jgi:hypothetical protein
MLNVNTSGGSLRERTESGELMRLVGERLTRNGLDVRRPEEPGRSPLSIAGQGMPCELSVNDSGYVQLECGPRTADEADPGQLADLAFTLLTSGAEDQPHHPREAERHGLTLKGIVGRELRDRGLAVALNVYADEIGLDTYTEIVVTSPDSTQDAEVRVTDDGGLTWLRDYWAEAAAITLEPTFSWSIPDPAKLADDIAATVTLAISRGLTGGQVNG